MKKLTVTFLMVCLALKALAVEVPKQGFGFQIGWAQPIMRLNTDESKNKLSNTVKLNGVKVGVVYDGSFIAGFGSTIALNYTFAASHTKWAKVNPDQIGLFPKQQDKFLYHELELVVDWQYKFEVAKETYIILYTGPTIQCGLAYNQKRFRDDGISDREKIIDMNHYTTDDPDAVYKRINVTWGVGAGFQYQRYFLRGGYDFGLIVPYKNSDFINGNHTRGRLDQWSIKIGAYLWYKD